MEGQCKLRVCACGAQMQALWPSCNNRAFKGGNYSPKLKKKYCRSKQTPKLIKQVVKVGLLGLVSLSSERRDGRVSASACGSLEMLAIAGGNAQVPACFGGKEALRCCDKAAV